MGENKKNNYGAAIGLACIMFGSQFGPAVASGTAVSAYNMQAGWLALVLPLLPVLLLAWVGYWGIEVSRLTGQTSLVALIKELFYPYDKIASVVWDIGTLILFPVVLGSALSGCGTVISSILGTGYTASLIITIVLFALIGLYGRKIMAKLSTIETIICLVIAAIFVIVCFGPGLENLGKAISENDLGPDTGKGLKLVVMGCFIACQNISVGIASAGNVLKSKSDTKVAIFTYVILYGLLQVLFGVCFFRLYPDIVSSSVPTLDVAKASGSAFVATSYPIMLLFAFLSTGPLYLFSLSDRWSKAGFWNKLDENNTLRKNDNIRFTIVLIIVLAVAFAVAKLGFRFIMVEIVPRQWLFYCIMLAIPMGIFAPSRVGHMRKELAETGHVTSAAEKRAAEQ